MAEELGIAESTARSYTKIDGFGDVVAHLEGVVRRHRIEQSDLETLEVILEYKPKVLRALAEQAIGEDGEPSPYAAAEFLRAIGFTDKNIALAELTALDEAGGGGGGDIEVNTDIDS